MAAWHWASFARIACWPREKGRARATDLRRRLRWSCAWGARLVPCLTLALTGGCHPVTPEKKLIAFGWDEPDTAFLRRHIGSMETLPFEGCVFHALAVEPDGRAVNLAWRFWGSERFTAQALDRAREDLWKTPRDRFRSNFLRLNVTPGDVGWFGDFSAILANARLAAHLARDGGCAGILLDTEPYEAPLFDYQWQSRNVHGSWEAYAAQSRQRGRELMHAFEQGFPGLTVFVTFGYELPWMELTNGRRALAECPRGLLAPFLDGLVTGAQGGRARVVDGFEPSYGYRDPSLFAEARRTLLASALPLVGDTRVQQTKVSVGFGLWLDYDWRRLGWHPDAPARNYFTPEALEKSLCAALEASDEYVWLYTETPRRWTADGSRAALPDEYIAAIRRARRCAGLRDE
jgi:hypothetical protein